MRWRSAIPGLLAALALLACAGSPMSRTEGLIAARTAGAARGTLMIPSEALTAAELAIVLADPRIPPLRELSLHHNALTAASVPTLLASPKLTALENLNLSNNPIGSAGIARLAEAPLLDGVRRLNLAATGVDASAARALAASSHTAKIAEIELGFQPIGAGASAWIGRRERLSLASAEIDGATARALLAESAVAHLTLEGNPIRDLTGLSRLSDAIVTLDLTACGLTDTRPLTAVRAPALRALTLDSNPIGDAGLRDLAAAPWLPQLEFLSVMGTKGTAEGREVLRSAWGARPGLTAER